MKLHVFFSRPFVILGFLSSFSINAQEVQTNIDQDSYQKITSMTSRGTRTDNNFFNGQIISVQPQAQYVKPAVFQPASEQNKASFGSRGSRIKYEMVGGSDLDNMRGNGKARGTRYEITK